MAKFEIDLSDGDAEALQELARRCAQGHEQGALTSHGPLDADELLKLLAQDAAQVVRRPGSWEASNLAEVLYAHGYKGIT